ncbi:replication-associated recombination protein A [Magnetococcales bacterium HHB-1]
MSFPPTNAPLAERMRPTTLEEILGQEKLTQPGGLLEQALKAKALPSMILWGPPGCGKTTLARVLAQQSLLPFKALSAVFSGVKDLRAVATQAKKEQQTLGQGILLFIDEIHRFNKGQQDALLPQLEDGAITLIGATTENPSFELNNALLSRCRVFTLEALQENSLRQLLHRAIKDKTKGYGNQSIHLEEGVLERISQQATGDARYALNILETLIQLSENKIAQQQKLTQADLEKSYQSRAALYDKAGDGHYNLISALHKSLRGSDPDASLYWLARMLNAGEEPLYIARRLVRFASEDIGNADPQALALTLQAKESYQFLGSPEGELALAQAVVYLATAPKSNSVYLAFKKVQKVAKKSGQLSPPKTILNAPTTLMKNLGYSKGYLYPHDYEEGCVNQDYFPESLTERQFYQPVERGFEREISRRLNYWQRLKRKKQEE